MSKIKFARYPRSIVRKRPDYPTSLFITVPSKTVRQWELKAGDIVEFVHVVEGSESYIKMRKVNG